MKALAEIFNAKVMGTLELLKIMLDCAHIDESTVKSLCDYWMYIDDRPAYFTADYQRLFPNQNSSR